MTGEELRQRTRAGGVVYGTMLSTARNPRWAATIAAFDLDYVIIDTEHSPQGRSDVANLLAALGGTGTVPIVRIPIPDSHYVTMALDAGAQEPPSLFNPLVLEKADLENRSAVRTLECFPFVENIGFTEDQKTLVGNCLAGLRTLKEALAEVPEADYHTVGISHRFLRSGGFQTILVPWDAGKEEMVRFLKKRLSDSERARFLDNIFSLADD